MMWHWGPVTPVPLTGSPSVEAAHATTLFQALQASDCSKNHAIVGHEQHLQHHSVPTN